MNLSSKRKQQIPKEIPQCGGTYGKHLAEVEVPLQFAVEQVDRQRVDAHTDQRDNEILRIFRPNLWVGAFESPDAIEKVIGGGGENEAQNVTQVFVPFQPFLADVGDTKVDKDPRKTDHAEFQEFH